MPHRAGWDLTFNAPKTVSLTALVGNDDHVREAHREAVVRTLDYLERYTQARIGGNAPAQTTGKWATATFEHDTARPVGGYPAPHLHTHAIVFNMTGMLADSTGPSSRTSSFVRRQWRQQSISQNSATTCGSSDMKSSAGPMMRPILRATARNIWPPKASGTHNSNSAFKSWA